MSILFIPNRSDRHRHASQSSRLSHLDADDAATREAISKGIEEATLLGRAATLEDVGHAATFAASDWAPTMTGAALNISCGAFMD